jgi:cytochrome c oxidase cbb3-type subunit 3
MGPPLLDDKWIYGFEPDTVFETIVSGRPNGMPSFAGKIPNYQVWQLVGYVRSMSGLLPKDAAPARDDHMQLNPPENTKDPERPRIVPSPPDVLPIPSTNPRPATHPTTTSRPTTTTRPGGNQ